jgi:hypothetical protein
MAGKGEEFGMETAASPNLAPILARLAGLTKLCQTQLVGMQELQRTLDEDVASILHNLEQRPMVDVMSITDRLDQTIDAVDRVMQRRIPRLMSRRWWIVWLWLVTGIALGVSGCWWVTQTARGRQTLAYVWPQGAVPQAVTPLRKK